MSYTPKYRIKVQIEEIETPGNRTDISMSFFGIRAEAEEMVDDFTRRIFELNEELKKNRIPMIESGQMELFD